jgi:phytoene dehydrogenase-like protein
MPPCSTVRLPSRHPLCAARFGFAALRSAKSLAGSFHDELAPALMTGLSGHAMVPLGQPLTSAFGLVLGISAHAYGWPVVRGGTQVMADAMAASFRSLGGEIVTGRPITSLDELPAARAILFDTTPRALAAIAGDRLPDRYRRRIEGFRYGAGIFKLDWALDGPIPWRTESVGRAGTVHLGGTWREVAAAEDDVTHRRHPDRPFVILVQASKADPSRAPQGRETGWAYCHVPNGSTVDMTERIEAQVERFAPGFRDRILARAVRSPARLEHDNPNYVGGDINGGIQDWRQLFTRPVAKIDPTRRPPAGCTSARRRLRRAAACTACAASGPRDRPSNGVRHPRVIVPGAPLASLRSRSTSVSRTASAISPDRSCRQDHEQDGHAGGRASRPGRR